MHATEVDLPAPRRVGHDGPGGRRRAAGGEVARVTGVDDEAVTVEVRSGAAPGAKVKVRLALRNAEIEGQTHPTNTLEAEAEFTVGAQP